MIRNKKGIIQFGIIAIALAVIVVGFLAFNPFKAKAQGLTEEQVNALIEKIKPSSGIGSGTIKTEPTETRDNNPTTPEQPSTPENTPTQPPQKQCEITGEWQELWVKKKTGIDKSGFNVKPSSKAKGRWKYTGTCTQDIYLEAGIIKGSRIPLAIEPFIGGAIPTTPSWCDNSLNYYGHLWKGARTGDLLRVDFKPKTYEQDGGYKLVIGAYTGCLSQKTTDKPISSTGIVITDNTYDMRISDKLYREQPLNIVETREALESWERVK